MTIVPMKLLICVAAVATLFAGCASTETAPGAEPKPVTERVYRTGSNIPVRDPVQLTPEEKERQAEAARNSLMVSPRGLPNKN